LLYFLYDKGKKTDIGERTREGNDLYMEMKESGYLL